STSDQQEVPNGVTSHSDEFSSEYSPGGKEFQEPSSKSTSKLSALLNEQAHDNKKTGKFYLLVFFFCPFLFIVLNVVSFSYFFFPKKVFIDLLSCSIASFLPSWSSKVCRSLVGIRC